MLKIYYIKLSDLQDYPEDFFHPYVTNRLLSNLQNYKCEKVRRTKLIGEMMTRKIAQQLRGGRISDYDITHNEHGKPSLSNILPKLFFNISHSGDYIVVAFSEQEIGIDIERIGRRRMEVARRFYHPAEVEALERAPLPDQDSLFFRLWSIKESFLKYTGTGLSASLSSFQVKSEDNIPYILQHDGQRLPVHIRQCRIDENYACYVCAESEDIPELIQF